jgi:lipopolysaccharide transport system permease protein
MAGVVEGFRWALLGRADPPGPMLAVSVAIVASLLVSGVMYFRRVERFLADVV